MYAAHSRVVSDIHPWDEYEPQFRGGSWRIPTHDDSHSSVVKHDKYNPCTQPLLPPTSLDASSHNPLPGIGAIHTLSFKKKILNLIPQGFVDLPKACLVSGQMSVPSTTHSMKKQGTDLTNLIKVYSHNAKLAPGQPGKQQPPPPLLHAHRLCASKAFRPSRESLEANTYALVPCIKPPV